MKENEFHFEQLPMSDDEKQILDSIEFWKKLVFASFGVPMLGPSPLYRVVSIVNTIKILDKYRALYMSSESDSEKENLIRLMKEELENESI